jgi:hypothetical protein
VQEERRHIVSQHSNNVGNWSLRKHTTNTDISEVSTEEFKRMHVSVRQDSKCNVFTENLRSSMFTTMKG